MDGLQKKLFKCSWSFLLFSVGVCHAKGESLLSLFSFFFFLVHGRVLSFYGEEMDWSF